MNAPEIKIMTLREQGPGPNKDAMDRPEKVFEFWNTYVKDSSWYDPMKEASVVFLLDTKRFLIAYHLVSLGTLDSTLIHPREVFRPAVIQSASAILFVHNHPSGDPTPSEADIKVTRDLIRAGKLLRIELLDSLIMGFPRNESEQGYASLRELGYFYQ
jgi:DNA repair protein RadC